MLKVRKIMATTTILLLAMLVAAWFFVGELAAIIILFLTIVLSVIVQVFLYNRSVSLRERDYQQIESLFSIFSQIRFNAPLPKTRGSAVAPDFIAMLIGMIKVKKPRVIVELGSGISTIISAYTLQSIGAGVVISLEHEEKYWSITKENLIRHDLQDFAKVIHAPLKRIKVNEIDYLWYDLDSLKDIVQIDMLIIDGPPHTDKTTARYPALPLLFDRLSTGFVVILDDAIREGERKVIKMWLKEFDHLSAEFLPIEHGACLIKKIDEIK